MGQSDLGLYTEAAQEVCSPAVAEEALVRTIRSYHTHHRELGQQLEAELGHHRTGRSRRTLMRTQAAAEHKMHASHRRSLRTSSAVEVRRVQEAARWHHSRHIPLHCLALHSHLDHGHSVHSLYTRLADCHSRHMGLAASVD